ncbi:hypothetical protein Acr_18g0006500 [Actinidia rufa]|uniref:Uncharacterized protein n=1 Tax=Actinidia rufa TaxID=165716 RepID=A0A7J0G6R2_9ERIC|nr:hypothetical protein Acr_18g0006500 [Actinidia rufa]
MEIGTTSSRGLVFSVSLGSSRISCSGKKTVVVKKLGRATNSHYCSVSSALDLGYLKGDLHRRTDVNGRGEAAQNPSGVEIRPMRESRKGLFPCIDRILVEMESLEMEILSILPRPRARRRQYFGSGRTDEYSDGDSGELSGDDLARFHGLVLPWSRGFGDGVWRSTCGDGTS